MITREDIEAMQDSPAQRIDYMNDPIFQRLQWEVRAAFESGYMAAGVGRGQSLMDAKKGKWFDHWLMSKHRAFLVNNGLMTGDEGYK